jgi:hypothetical protein
MAAKSITFVVEITIATLREEGQTKEVLAAMEEGIQEGVSGFANHIASGTDGVFIATAKIVEQSTDWQ